MWLKHFYVLFTSTKKLWSRTLKSKTKSKWKFKNKDLSKIKQQLHCVKKICKVSTVQADNGSSGARVVLFTGVHQSGSDASRTRDLSLSSASAIVHALFAVLRSASNHYSRVVIGKRAVVPER